MPRRSSRRRCESTFQSRPPLELEKPSNEFLVSNFEPYRILDIERSSEDGQFSFVVVFTSILNQNIKKNFRLSTLDFLTERYRTWLLSLFKKNLKDLVAIKNMKGWAAGRTLHLRDYCTRISLNFDSLYFRSTLPPTQVYSAQPAVKPRRPPVENSADKQSKSENFSPSEFKARSTRKTRTQKTKSCCKTMNALAAEESGSRFAWLKSKTNIIKSLSKKLGHFIDKYRDMANSSVSKEDLMRDLNELRNFL